MLNKNKRDQEQSQINLFHPEISIFLHKCATCSELPSNISTMGVLRTWKEAYVKVTKTLLHLKLLYQKI